MCVYNECTTTKQESASRFWASTTEGKMATTDAQTHSNPAGASTAPVWASSSDLEASGDSPQASMPFSCQACAKRKVKCDKTTPICSSCRKSKLECSYQAPPPRRRRRRLSGDVNEKLAQYERILHQHGLLPHGVETSPSIEEVQQDLISLRFMEPETSRTGKLLAGDGKSRYIDSNFWRNLGDDEIERINVDEEEDRVATGVDWNFASDPLTGAFMVSQHSLFQYHPTHAEAITLWKTHVDNVEPLCKILHIPSTFKMLETASQQPLMASKAEECLLFAVYHFAVFSMTEEECTCNFGNSRATLIQIFNFATRQALVNASFLKTTEMSVLQALVLFLLACRFSYDPQTYWILTGVAVRIAQRMGLHRDGENLGLPPFDVQMRRRLFYQLIPLDSVASQLSGTGIAIMPESWDTQRPLNINDDQIWPGMTEMPEEQKGATEMIYCLARSCVGKYSAMTGKATNGAASWQFKNYTEAEAVISQAESEVEENYIRYCDIINPLHFLTVGLARSAITAMRLRIRLPKVRNRTATDAEKREMLQLSQKIIDIDTAAYAQTSLKRYQWQVGSFFAWGSWDSLTFILTCLQTASLLSLAEADAAWSRVEQVFNNHSEVMESDRALQVAIRRFTLKAWDASGKSSAVPEPAFITTLRSLQKENFNTSTAMQNSSAAPVDTKTNPMPPTEPSPANGVNMLLGSSSSGMDLDTSFDFNLDTADWMLWEQLIQDYQAKGS